MEFNSHDKRVVYHNVIVELEALLIECVNNDLDKEIIRSLEQAHDRLNVLTRHF